MPLPPLSLYIHIPWCIKKCPYCDFNSHAVKQPIPETDYVKALLHDLDQQRGSAQGRKLQSIFFGGGTPSLFSARAIATLLKKIEQTTGFTEGIEITLEANPGTTEQEKFNGYFNAGVNRLSIGVQSFNNHHLQQLGRIHNSGETISAIATAKQAGFENVNLDLMHGLPAQSPADALLDLQQAIDLQAQHISWYQLTIENNTQFYNTPPPLPDDDALADIQDQGEQLLAANGLVNYEVSAFSRAGRQSRHNLNYWQFGDYIGIGAGAHSKITSSQGVITRHWKTRQPRDYLNNEKPYTSGSRILSREELPLEFVINALRLNQGFSKQLFTERTGLEYVQLQKTVSELIEQGLLTESRQHIMTSKTGRRFLNDVLAAF